MELVSLLVVADTMMIKKSASPTAIVCRGYYCQVPRSVKNEKFVVGFQTARTRAVEHSLAWHSDRIFQKVEVKASHKLEVQQISI
jgi:hypothetical protein